MNLETMSTEALIKIAEELVESTSETIKICEKEISCNLDEDCEACQ